MAKYFEKGKRRNDQKEYQQIKMFSLTLYILYYTKPASNVISSLDHY